MIFMSMLTKELKELARSYKLLFVPLLFALLGVSQPVSFKMMPTLLASAGNLPKGTVIEIPVPPPGEVVAQAIGQFNQAGILLLVLIAMGAIAGERLSGVAATVLTKPVGRGEYLLAKASAFSLLAVFSLAAGMALTAYYTQVLVGPVDWSDVAVGSALYLPNLLLAIAVTLSLSTFMPSPLAAGGTALVTVMVLNTVPRYLGPTIAKLHPGKLTESAVKALAGQEYIAAGPIAGVAAMIAVALVLGWLTLRRQEI
ncbi:MAG: ABC transporter permease [Bacillota bacterium]